MLVVVAEILLNRLLQASAFDFTNVAAVVMDEFHSFADVQRGIVWEMSLAMLPPHVRLLLLSATVGNAREFLGWLINRTAASWNWWKGPTPRAAEHRWVGDQLLNEQIDADGRRRGRHPAYSGPGVLLQSRGMLERGRAIEGLPPGFRTAASQLIDEVNRHDWSQGVGPKLKQLLHRGVGVHHAGLLPKYRRIVEELFQRKLLAVCMCTETLAAGINLPARSAW